MATDFAPYYRLWARQLLAEFEFINQQYRLGLLPPIIEISQSGREHGSWQATTRTIRISAPLITTCSWDVTCQILKHEMAHQICSERFLDNDCAHGPVFQKACDLLGLPPGFRHASADLPGSAPTDPADGRESEKGRQLVKRITKLLALARSANQHEAALAMEKASLLMTRHNLRQIQEESQSDFSSLIINTHSRRIETWQRRICTILLRFFHVRVVTASLYDPLHDTHHKTIELLGRRENVTIAEYCYSFLSGQIAFLWRQNRSRLSSKGLRGRNSYYLGLLQGFNDKLNHRETEKASTPPKGNKATEDAVSASLSLLLRTEEAALDRFVAMRFPALRKRRHGKSMIYQNTYELGRTEGRQISLHAGVTGQNREPGLLMGK